MYTTINDFAVEWESEARLTQNLLDGLTDESLGQPIGPGRRTLGQLAWHLVTSVRYMSSLGLSIEGSDEADDGSAPESAARIAEQYRKLSLSLSRAVRAKWNDDSLREKQTIMGREWGNGDSLRFTIMHQAHHRGQLTVLIRQAGLRPPEIYGPTYDDWVDKGLAPLA